MTRAPGRHPRTPRTLLGTLPRAMIARVLFELEDVRAGRGGRVVFERLTTALAEGATGIVGPSGAGKSTLLRFA
jgi:ABC-type transporter Mla maintaining outer membrane lipid asymmetry ATPase subunit MlaF